MPNNSEEPNKIFAPFPTWVLQPRVETGATSFLKKYPEYDGRGTVIAIFDSGVDPGAGGLQVTSDGKRKIIDRIDASGAGDVDTSVLGKVSDSGDGPRMEGLTGRELVVPRDWNNPSGKYRLGVKRAFDLYPRMLRERVVRERQEKMWDPRHRECLAEALKQQSELEDAAKDKPRLDPSYLEKENIDNEIEMLNQIDKKFREPNGDIGNVYDIVVYHDGDQWVVVIDTSQTGDLASGLRLRSFKETGDFGVLSPLDQLNVSVNVYDDGNTTQIVSMCSSHGTHVASIAAAHFPDEPEKNGLAPGAQIVSVSIGDGRLSSMETGTALARAMYYVMQNKVDVINMSYGEHSHWSNTGRIGDLMNEVVNKHGIVWVASAGNDGPALCTVGTPPDISTSTIIGVGAYVSPEMMAALYSSREKLPGTHYTWTSRGPTIDGDRGVCICAPGGAITSVPQFTLRGSQLMNGTSMASPHVCGAVSVLLSGMRQRNLPWSPYSVKRALEVSAKNLPHLCHYAQGHGLLQVESAFNHLVKHSDCEERDVRFAVSCNSGSNTSKGIHLRDEAATKTAEIPVKVEPVFINPDYQPSEKKVNFNMKFVLDCPESWVKAPDHLDLMYVTRHFLLWIDPTSLPPGVHSTYVKAYDVAQVDKGALFEIPITVVRPEPLLQTPRPHIAYSNVHFRPGSLQRHFVSVPDGATWAVVNVKSCDKTNVGKFVLHTVQLWPKMVVKTLEHHKMFTLPENGEFNHAIKVKGGTTLEVCLAKWWANIGEVNLSYSVTFHGISLACLNDVVMHGGEGIFRLDLTSAIHNEEAQPEIKLKSSVQVLRPSESKVLPLGDRDVIPVNRRVYELVLQYNFSVAKQTDVTPNIPLLSDVLYESEFESQLWMICDQNKQVICYGDAYPTKWTAKLDKGDYVLRAHVRSERRDVLEKMTDINCLISQKLSSQVTPDVFTSFAQASIGGKKSNSFTIPRGKTVPVYVAPLASDKYCKNASLGQYLSGTLTVAKDEAGKKTDTYTFKYILPEAAKKDKSKGSSSSDSKKSKLDEYNEATRDLKITWLSKLDPFEMGKTLFNEMINSPDVSVTYKLMACGARISALEMVEQGPPKLPVECEVKDCADKMLKLVNPDTLLAYFGTKTDNRPDAAEIKKEMDKQRTCYLEAIARAGHIHVKRNEMADATALLAQALKFVEITDSKIVNFAAFHAEKMGHFGRALKLVAKQMEEKPSVETERKMIDLYERLDWDHCEAFARKALAGKYPKAYPPF